MKSNQELDSIYRKMVADKGGNVDGMEELDKYYKNPIVKMLFIIHHHELESEKIIYREEDIVDLLTRLGFDVEFK